MIGHTASQLELRRLVLACASGKDGRREKNGELARQIAELVPKVAAFHVAALAVEARKLELRYLPLFLVREMARHKTHRAFVADTLVAVIQRPDELVDFVAIYWKDGRVPLSAQAKKGLAAAFPRFDEQALAAYRQRGDIHLRDILFLCHAKPRNAAQAGVWKKLIWKRLSPATMKGAR
jgi:60 kDa SS-A/Ro ribonucleoprotein